VNCSESGASLPQLHLPFIRFLLPFATLILVCEAAAVKYLMLVQRKGGGSQCLRNAGLLVGQATKRSCLFSGNCTS